MPSHINIGLVGDYDNAVIAHQAIALALQPASWPLAKTLSYEWLATERITSTEQLKSFHGLWCVPASPYKSMDGALLAIRYARESATPFFGSCGGFQHALIEYARNVLGWADADHAETSGRSTRPVISPLSCSLVETSGQIHLQPGSRIANAYQCATISETYHCRYGVNPQFQQTLCAGPLRASAFDEQGEVRATELDGHPFFVATLFQSERRALAHKPAPIIEAFVRAAAQPKQAL